MSEPGHNGFDSTTVKRFLGEAMRVYDKLDAQKIENMNICREIRAPLKDIKKAAKNAGLPKAAFNALIKSELAKRNYEKAIDSATPEDDEDRDAWEAMREIAGSGDLFEAAVKRHDETQVLNDDVVDFRGAGQKRRERERKEEADRVAAERNAELLKQGISGLPNADATEA